MMLRLGFGGVVRLNRSGQQAQKVRAILVRGPDDVAHEGIDIKELDALIGKRLCLECFVRYRAERVQLGVASEDLVADEDERLGWDVDARFFFQFTACCLCWRFAFLDFAAREVVLPLQKCRAMELEQHQNLDEVFRQNNDIDVTLHG